MKRLSLSERSMFRYLQIYDWVRASHGQWLAPGNKVEFNSHQYFGTVSLVPAPASRELARLTQVALRNMRYGLLQEAKLPPRPNQPPRPVPDRAGEDAPVLRSEDGNSEKKSRKTRYHSPSISLVTGGDATRESPSPPRPFQLP